jgi:arylsulfatase A-like enzyme
MEFVMDRRVFIKITGASLLGLAAGCEKLYQVAASKPNIIFIFVDDMGYADASCFGNEYVSTPHIDRLAAEGTRFTQFYVNSPVCSPSRVAVTTGQYPSRWGVHSYLDWRKSNKRRQMVDYLDKGAPSLARQLKAAGYGTAHFGKWHMGGGRDVDDAPHPQAYGFDVASVACEGLGDRILCPDDHLSNVSEKLGQGNITKAPKHKLTEIRVNQTIDYIKSNAGKKPVYVNLWLNDVHDDHEPAEGEADRYKEITDNPFEQEFYAVLVEMDKQIGRLMAALKECGQDENTLVVFTSDNGPTDWPMYYKEGWNPPGLTGPLYGRKWSLYEGGIRMPFIVRWPGQVPAGETNKATVMCGVDLFPTLCKIAAAKLPGDIEFDGEDMSEAILGETVKRSKPIMWYYPNQPKPGKAEYVTPKLAIRKDDWKLLINPDRSDAQLYNLSKDIGEKNNLIDKQPEVAKELTQDLMDWHKTLLFRK